MSISLLTSTTTNSSPYKRSHNHDRRSNFMFRAAAILSPRETLVKKLPLVSLPAIQADDVLKRVSAESLQYESGYLGTTVPRRWSSSESSASLAMEHLANILTSKVYDVAVESPLQLAEKLSYKLGNHVWFKREDVQPVSVKLLLSSN